MTFLAYMRLCAQAWRFSKDRPRYAGASYFGLERHGVPSFAVLIAHGREAWQVTQIALEHGFTNREYSRPAPPRPPGHPGNPTP